MILHIVSQRKDGKYNVKINFRDKQITKIMDKESLKKQIEKSENKEVYKYFN